MAIGSMLKPQICLLLGQYKTLSTGPCIHMFLPNIYVIWPCVPTQWNIFLTQVFLEIRLSSESLEPMISFLAYLRLKLWLKNQILDENSSSTKGNLGNFG